MRRVLVDANVFVSFFIDRNAAQHAAARALIQSAEDGEIVAVVPQSVVFEVTYFGDRRGQDVTPACADSNYP